MTRPKNRLRYAQRPFAEELVGLLAESDYTTTGGRPNVAAFARELQGISYEALRRALHGQNRPGLAMLRECSRVLMVPEDYFLEARLIRARSRLDSNEVGWETAAAYLADGHLLDEGIRDAPPPPPHVVDAVARLFAEYNGQKR